MGKKFKTAVEKRTLFPCYYTTFVFDNVTIPQVDNYLYAPQVGGVFCFY